MTRSHKKIFPAPITNNIFTSDVTLLLLALIPLLLKTVSKIKSHICHTFYLQNFSKVGMLIDVSSYLTLFFPGSMKSPRAFFTASFDSLLLVSVDYKGCFRKRYFAIFLILYVVSRNNLR